MDLIIGVLFVLAASVGAFALGRTIGQSPRLGLAAAILAVLGILFWFRWLKDDLFLAHILPFSNVIVVGNFVPELLGLLLGSIWKDLARKRRRIVYLACVLGVGGYCLWQPIVGMPPQCNNFWSEQVCYQTTEHTCTPACAATVLSHVGIEATEQEMAKLCLTRDGTQWQGLYRGLKLKTKHSAWQVDAFRADTDTLLESPAPAIISVGLPTNLVSDNIYTQRYGWTPGRRHSVVFLGRVASNRVSIIDPTPDVGAEEWTETDLRTLFLGIGVRILPRHR